jgi:hypothetical protein
VAWAGRDRWCSAPPSVPKYKLQNNYMYSNAIIVKYGTKN